MAKFCTNCGNPIEEGAVFCDNCGAKLDIEQYTQAVQQPKSNQPSAQNVPYNKSNVGAQTTKKSKNSKTIVIINIVLLIVLLLQIAIACFIRPGWIKTGSSGSVGFVVNNLFSANKSAEWVNIYWSL